MEKKRNRPAVQPKPFFDTVAEIVSASFSQYTRILGPGLVAALYGLLGLHVYAFFWVVVPLLKRRLGTVFGMVWIAIGLALLYNILFNHTMAWIIKPTGPKELKQIEKLRKNYKQRANRKSVSD
jgi:drug/metabolite transporter (DMT)-like permease